MTTEKLLTRPELAELFSVSIATIHRWERAGKLKPVRLSANVVRYLPAQVQQLLAEAEK
jgi:predicted site-specific integrase-resolvase